MQQLAVFAKKQCHRSLNRRFKERWHKNEKIPLTFGLSQTKIMMGHLTLEQRYKIESYLELNKSKTEIAEYIGKNKSSIGREIKRNCDQRSKKYCAELAHRKAQKRHKKKKKKKYFTKEIKQVVNQYLQRDFSPEQIVGRMKLENKKTVSHETIYKFIWADKKEGGDLYKHLRTKGKKYKKRGRNKDSRGIIKGRVDISERPEIVDKKERIGDLEIDLIIGKNHKGALLTINDRATGVLKMAKVKTKEAWIIEKKTIELLKDWKPFIFTITSDNGKEFANHVNISKKLDINFYFARPYHSWERGANENLNGLVRQYFPKGLEFSSITNEQILTVTNILNNRPRKRFGFKTPNEIFSEKFGKRTTVAFIT